MAEGRRNNHIQTISGGHNSNGTEPSPDDMVESAVDLEDKLEKIEKENRLDMYYVILAVLLGMILIGVLIYFSITTISTRPTAVDRSNEKNLTLLGNFTLTENPLEGPGDGEGSTVAPDSDDEDSRNSPKAPGDKDDHVSGGDTNDVPAGGLQLSNVTEHHPESPGIGKHD